MGESVKAWILPGSTTSFFIAPGFGWMTETAGMASSRVVSFTAAAVWMRALMPKKTMPATISHSQHQKHHHPQRSRTRAAGEAAAGLVDESGSRAWVHYLASLLTIKHRQSLASDATC